MSMHDIEGFAEEAVLFVGTSSLSDSEKIELIHNIYRFHDAWDTGFTKLRVYDTLIDTGYFYPFAPADHPEYQTCKNFFDDLPDSSFTFIHENPVERSGPITCYWVETVHDQNTGEEFEVRTLCCEAGSALWAQFTGRKQPEDTSALAMMLRLAELASETGRYRVLADLFGMAPYMMGDEAEIEGRKNRAQLERLRELVSCDGAFELLARQGVRYEELEEFSDDARWWMSGYLDWLAAHVDENPGPATLDEATTQELIETARSHTESYEEMIAAFAGQDIARAMNAYWNLGEDFRSLLEAMLAAHMGLSFYENLPEGKVREYLALDETKLENPYMADFVRTLRGWTDGRDKPDFYRFRAAELLNSGRRTMARVFIDGGLALAPEDDMLRLYRAAAVIAGSTIDGGEAAAQAPVAGELAARDDFPHRPYATYLHAMLLYYSGNQKAARAAMKQAAAMDPVYEAQYQRYFVKKKK